MMILMCRQPSTEHKWFLFLLRPLSRTNLSTDNSSLNLFVVAKLCRFMSALYFIRSNIRLLTQQILLIICLFHPRQNFYHYPISIAQYNQQLTAKWWQGYIIGTGSRSVGAELSPRHLITPCPIIAPPCRAALSRIHSVQNRPANNPSHITSFVQYNRPSLPVLFWRVVFLNTTLQDRQPAKPDLAVPRLV